jgi:hypothetical protein
VTVDENPQPAGASDVEKITATILTAVERQLTRYFAAISQQVEGLRQKTELAHDQLRTELADGVPRLERTIEAQRAANEQYQRALQAALEERLAEFANHQHGRMNQLEDKIGEVSGASSGIDPETLLEIRQSVRDDMERSFGAIHGRLDDLANTDRRLDEQGSALVQHVNDSTAALALRMDQGDERLTHAVEERLNGFHGDLQQTLDGVAAQVDEQAATLLAKIDSSETRAIDRLLELEQRIKEEQGTKLANLEATVGRIGSGFDDAMVAVNQRVLELENRLVELDERLVEMGERVAKVDEEALAAVRSEISTAVGEAMLVRIELDRAMATTDEKLDKAAVRMAEIEGLLSDTMDVSTAVQLERLDELERQMRLIDPAGVTVTPASAMPAAAPSPTAEQRQARATSTDERPAADRPAPPSMSLNPRLPGADTTSQETHDSETSASSR